MTSRVLFVGLDSADPGLIDRYEAGGLLPTISRLRREGATFELENSIHTLADTIWPEVWSGRSSRRTGLYCPYFQFAAGELEPRPRRMDEFDPRSFWTAAAEADRRVAVVDVPFAIPVRGLDGVQLVQWGAHDRPYADAQKPLAEPAKLLEEVGRRYGVHPVWAWNPPPRGAGCDGHRGRPRDRERLFDHLLAGLEVSSRLRLDLLAREGWDVFACGLGEYQCAGHHFWGFEEEDGAPARLRRALRDVYVRLDEALGTLVDAAGEGATAIVLASHGHGPHTGGGQLLPEVLDRLGMGSRHGVAASARRWVPPALWAAARRFAPRAVKRTVHPPLFASPSARAMAVAVDGNAWIRLNLRGREPRGAVAPGAEARALLDELRAELLRLEQPGTGERLLTDVVVPGELVDDVHPDVPDLVVGFRDDLGPIESCWSPRVGLVERPFPVPAHRRSSHRLGDSRLWVRGPGVAAGSAGSGSIVDVAPTVLACSGVAVPRWMDGRPLETAPIAQAGASR